MVKTLELVIAKATALSEPAQDELGRLMLRCIERLEALQAEIDVGIRQLDAGLGRELDIDEFMKELRERHASKGNG
jgi:hypothetical protein